MLVRLNGAIDPTFFISAANGGRGTIYMAKI